MFKQIMMWKTKTTKTTLLRKTMRSFQKNEVDLEKVNQNVPQDVLFSEKQGRDIRYTKAYTSPHAHARTISPGRNRNYYSVYDTNIPKGTSGLFQV